MNVKRYEASTMQAALGLVKKDLGPNAFVLSTQRKIKKGLLGIGGKEVFEISATAGESDSPLDQSDNIVMNDNRLETQPQPAGERIFLNQTTRTQIQQPVSVDEDKDDFREMASLLSYGKGSKPAITTKPAIHRTTAKQIQPVLQTSMEDELRDLTKTINGIVASGTGRTHTIGKEAGKTAQSEIQNRVYRTARLTDKAKPVFGITAGQVQATAVKTATEKMGQLRQVEQYLVSAGLDPDVIKLLLPSATDTNNPSLSLQSLKTQISLRLGQIVNASPVDDLLKGNVRAAVLFGPTGVGKTTTIAKLAARAILKYGRKVVLVTLDTYRIGAIKQLGTYAEIIGVPLKVAKTMSEVEEILSTSPKDSLVLIDTIGRSPYKLGELGEHADYFRNEPQIRKYLTLTATTNTRDNLDIAAHFDAFGIDHTIITKADETTRHGTMINCLARLGKPVDYVTTGQSVPEDIQASSEETITDLLFDGLKS